MDKVNRFIKEKYNVPPRDNDPDIEKKDVDDILRAYLGGSHLIQHQLDSYNDFITRGFRDVIENYRILNIESEGKKYTIEFGESFICKPSHSEIDGVIHPVTPFECISRDITYQGELLVDIETTDFDGHVNRIPKYLLGYIPIMVRSSLCNLHDFLYDKEKLAKLKEDLYDSGGYFIVKGGAKVIISQERAAPNRTYAFENRKKSPGFSIYTEIRSHAPSGSHSTATQVGILKGGLIDVTIPYIESSSIPLGVVFRALGVEGKIESMVKYILPDLKDKEAVKVLVKSLEHSLEVRTQNQALLFIGKRGNKFTRPKKGGKNIPVIPEENDTKESLKKKKQIRKTFELEFESKETLKNMLEEAIERGYDSSTYSLAKDLCKLDSRAKITFIKLLRKKLEDLTIYGYHSIDLSDVLNSLPLKQSSTDIEEIIDTLEDLSREKITEKTVRKILKDFEVDCSVLKDILLYLRDGVMFSDEEIATNKISETIDQLIELDEESKQAISYARHLLSTELFPHLGTKEMVEKRFYLGYMVKKLLWVVLGRSPLQDRDHFANKRIATTGTLFTQQFEGAFRRLRNEIENSIEKVIRSGTSCIQVKSHINSKTITNAMVGALTDNSWGRGKSQGISQKLEQFNYISAISNLRKVVAPISQEVGKITAPRKLHPSHWGIICIAETPEGKKCVTLESVVSTPQGCIKMGDLKNNDSIWTVNPWNYSLEESKIYDYFQTWKEVYEIKSEGFRVEATLDHPFLTREGWVELGKLSVGFKVYTERGFETIKSITSTGIKKVADFTTVSPNHSFIANGFVTHNCGLVKNLALGCHVTIGTDPSPLLELLKTMDVIPFRETSQSMLSLVKIFVNGNPIGVTKHAEDFVRETRLFRRRGSLNHETSIAFDKIEREIRISTEGGRLCRPLFVVENGRILLRKSHIREIKDGEWNEPSIWYNLLDRGFVEFVDKDEEENLLVALNPKKLLEKTAKVLKYTHCEIDCALIFGIGASTIPFPHHNQAPRNTYQASMGKQAVGAPGLNYLFRVRDKFHVMDYFQKPITHSKIADMIGCYQLPMGQNAIVAICPWSGFNQEDSIVMNQSSIDRGFMNITTFISYEACVNRQKHEQFEIPIEAETNRFKGNIKYLKIDKIQAYESDNPKHEQIYCYASEGTIVNQGDVIIGKTVTEGESAKVRRKKKSDESVVYDQIQPGRVHLVQKGINGEGYPYIRLVVAQRRPPILADKLSACHGQKGTVGMTYRAEDLPFTREGIAPDILVNPAAFPSRMTIGMLIELLVGKKVCIGPLYKLPIYKIFSLDEPETEKTLSDEDIYDYGCDSDSEIEMDGSESEEELGDMEYSDFKNDGDATPFNEDFSLSRVCAELKKYGYDQFGDEMMINGMTGCPMKTLILTGVCYYQRLRHMVINKVHARSTGGKTSMTRQPPEGRKWNGGLRIGIMEKDTLAAQGCSALLVDRLSSQSDPYQMWICEYCGIQATAIRDGEVFCKLCTSKEVKLVRIPYATKLLTQELAGMNVIARFFTRKLKN